MKLTKKQIEEVLSKCSIKIDGRIVTIETPDNDIEIPDEVEEVEFKIPVGMLLISEDTGNIRFYSNGDSLYSLNGWNPFYEYAFFMLPKEAEWIAMDKDNNWNWYVGGEPTLCLDNKYSDDVFIIGNDVSYAEFTFFPHPDWTKSKYQKPEWIRKAMEATNDNR